MPDLVVHQQDKEREERAVLHVLFKVFDAEYALPVDTVLQMESFQGATPVPGAPEFVTGIIQIRGRVIPVVDLRIRFGFPPAPLTLDSRVVLGRHGERAVALLVDSAREVLTIPASVLKPPHKLLEGDRGGFVSAVAQLGSRLVMVLDFAKVIGEESLDVV
ncbi:chemotaxis protein CheW [Pendulispora albinea]|uniref:Chemotaxis protein CheW n=1 Tax=Pendulispora albinea TaxID=2741071 RepID=A0ABZ2M7H9_9BACT